MQMNSFWETKTVKRACAMGVEGGMSSFTIDLCIEDGSAFLVSLVSWHIPEFHEEVPFWIAF